MNCQNGRLSGKAWHRATAVMNYIKFAHLESKPSLLKKNSQCTRTTMFRGFDVFINCCKFGVIFAETRLNKQSHREVLLIAHL